MKVYLAGPMRGHPGWNFAAFDVARVRLTQLGYQVFCPALLVRAMPYGFGHESDRGTLVHVIFTDLHCIAVCDAIILLEGWADSYGAAVELAMAQFLGIPAYNEFMEPLSNLKHKPWSPRALVKPDAVSTGCSICHDPYCKTPNEQH